MSELIPSEHKFILYKSNSGEVNVEVIVKDESIWLTQKNIAQLFGVNVPAINKHLKKIFETGELDENSVISKMEITANDGKKYNANFYNLDTVIAVGYRVNSYEATQFRIWATKTLKSYIIKGFAIDDERLKQGNQLFGKDYFDELLEKIKEIRASERRFYQKITDIYSLSVDYDKNSPITRNFFASVQNKLHWAITGQTGAEIIYNSADANKKNMGLTNWKHSPDGKILKGDVKTAKNYLSEKHISELNGLVSSYLDLIELRAKRGILMNMKDWVKLLDDFLELSNYPILLDKGKISKAKAELKALGEYEKYRVVQDKNYISDFDREVEKRRKKDE